jgi:cellulose synthase/poly-beta-1,6-N-acetylglucosamine synthase-like glycosyltransferase
MTTLLISLCAFLLAYTFALYPGGMYLAARRRRPPAPQAGGELPSVALVICALNEQRIIRQKIENSLALDYPREKLRIVVVSDGSTDSTASIAAEYAARGVELIERPVRRGKVANLNEVVPALGEAIVVLSDANVIYSPSAVRRLVARFADPRVGCVSGKVVLTDSEPHLDGPTVGYYSVEWLLQEQASAIYSMAGADGAMYALRRELFRPCPADTLIEDFVIPMAVVRQGRRAIFEPSAIGWEKGPETLREEFRRKVRIEAGAIQALLRGNGWPVGAPARFWWIFLSHKLLRWLSPLLGAAMLVLCLFSLSAPLSRLLAGGCALMVALALVRPLAGWKNPIVSGCFYFLFGEAALAWGMVKGLAGRQTVLWAKVNR